MDIVSEEQRSYNMSRIRGKNTKPELIIRSGLHSLGYRFTVNGPKNRRLPGKPDLVLPRLNALIFVHGCFWHAHEGCPHFCVPATKSDWWREKLEGNRSRDILNLIALREQGWRVAIVWTCALRKRSERSETLNLLDAWLRNPEINSVQLQKKFAANVSCEPTPS